MTLETTLAAGRRVRKMLMTSRCRIVKPGDREFNPNTGEYESDETVVYEGICHFKSWSSLGQRIGNVASREMVLMMYEVLLPWEAMEIDISESDVVYITESDDPAIIGVPLPVISCEFNHDRTCRHLTVNEQGRGDVDYG